MRLCPNNIFLIIADQSPRTDIYRVQYSKHWGNLCLGLHCSPDAPLHIRVILIRYVKRDYRITGPGAFHGEYLPLKYSHRLHEQPVRSATYQWQCRFLCSNCVCTTPSLGSHAQSFPGPSGCCYPFPGGRKCTSTAGWAPALWWPCLTQLSPAWAIAGTLPTWLSPTRGCITYPIRTQLLWWCTPVEFAR